MASRAVLGSEVTNPGACGSGVAAYLFGSLRIEVCDCYLVACLDHHGDDVPTDSSGSPSDETA